MSQEEKSQFFKHISLYLLENCNPRIYNSLKLPIKKIDDIPVNVEFSYEGNHHEISCISCTIHLAPNNEYMMAEFVVRDFNEEFALEEGVKLIFEKINNLKFNQFKGLLCDSSKNQENNGIIKENIMITIYSILNLYENVTSSINDCCVCLEITETHSNCGHNVCIKCYSKLEVSKKEWREYYGRNTFYKKCPMCRGIIQKLLPETEIGELSEQLTL